MPSAWPAGYWTSSILWPSGSVIQLVCGPSAPPGSPGGPGRDPLGGKIGEGCVQRLDLDDEVADAGAEAGLASGRVVDQLDGDEMIAWQLEHAQAAERRPPAVPVTAWPTAA